MAAPGLSASTLSSILHEDSATQALLEKDAFQLLYFLCFSPQSKLRITNGQVTTSLWLL